MVRLLALTASTVTDGFRLLCSTCCIQTRAASSDEPIPRAQIFVRERLDQSHLPQLSCKQLQPIGVSLEDCKLLEFAGTFDSGFLRMNQLTDRSFASPQIAVQNR